MIPIPKVGKASKTAESFRPISLTSCFAKIYERLVNRRLTTFLEENKFLDQSQFAFRKGKGVGNYMATMRQDLDRAFEDEQHVELAVLDLSKAYNRVW